MTCGRRRFDAANGCDSVRRRISARLAVIRAEAAASAFLAAVALRQLLRCSGCSALRPNGQLVRGYSLPVSAVVARQQLSHQRGGSDGRTSATTQIVKTLHSCLDATGLYRAVYARLRESSSSRFRPARHQEDSTHASGSRGTLAPVKFTSGVQWPTREVHRRPEGSVGAT